VENLPVQQDPVQQAPAQQAPAQQAQAQQDPAQQDPAQHNSLRLINPVVYEASAKDIDSPPSELNTPPSELNTPPSELNTTPSGLNTPPRRSLNTSPRSTLNTPLQSPDRPESTKSPTSPRSTLNNTPPQSPDRLGVNNQSPMRTNSATAVLSVDATEMGVSSLLIPSSCSNVSSAVVVPSAVVVTPSVVVVASAVVAPEFMATINVGDVKCTCPCTCRKNIKKMVKSEPANFEEVIAYITELYEHRKIIQYTLVVHLFLSFLVKIMRPSTSLYDFLRDGFWSTYGSHGYNVLMNLISFRNSFKRNEGTYGLSRSKANIIIMKTRAVVIAVEEFHGEIKKIAIAFFGICNRRSQTPLRGFVIIQNIGCLTAVQQFLCNLVETHGIVRVSNVAENLVRLINSTRNSIAHADSDMGQAVDIFNDLLTQICALFDITID